MSINEGLWSARLPNGDVRAGTLQQLSEAFRAGHLAESTLVCAAGSTNWIRLADVLGSAAAFATAAPVTAPRPSASPPQPIAPPRPPSVSPPTNGSLELWQVRLPTGDVRTGTRTQLEEAFRAGHLDENALALAPGAREWSKLGPMLRGSQPPHALVPPSVHPPASVAPPPVSPAVAAPPAAVVAPPAPVAAPPPAPPAIEGNDMLWQVRLANGQVRSGTRRQLEEAFNAGHLDESEYVLPAGSSEWVKLGDVMDRRPLAPVSPPVMSPAPPTVVAVQPTPTAIEPAPGEAAETAPNTAESEPASAEQDAPQDVAPPEPIADVAANHEASEAGQMWQVKLTLKQLEEGFHAGLLDDDTPVQAAGDTEWVALGQIRREKPPPFGSALPAQHPEPASRTEPWPANAGLESSSRAGEVD